MGWTNFLAQNGGTLQKEKINFLKRKIYGEYCAGATQNYLSYKYQWDKADIKYLIQLVKMHGIEILDDKPVRYPLELKQEAVERVLINNESRRQVSLDLGLVDTKLLRDWINTFKQKGYNMFEKNVYGEFMSKKTEKTRLKQLEEENVYLRAEVEYLKKYNALVKQKEEAAAKKSQTTKKRK